MDIPATEGTDKKSYWDPIYEELPADMVAECSANNRKFMNKLNYYQAHPRRIPNNLSSLFRLALAITAVYFIAGNSEPNWNDKISLAIATAFAFLFSLLPLGVYYAYIRSLERPLNNLLLARKYGWLYNPNRFKGQWKLLVKKYPEVFKEIKVNSENYYYGHEEDRQFVYNQLWGRFDGVSFWSACLSGSLDGNNLKLTKKTIYAFHLKRPAAYSFLLKSQDLWTKTEAKIHSGLTTESNDFNRLFHIQFQGARRSAGGGIMQVLSPDVQEKLMAFRDNIGPFDLLFQGDVMLISLPRDFTLHATDFTQKVALNPRDIKSVARRMTAIIDLSQAILACLG